MINLNEDEKFLEKKRDQDINKDIILVNSNTNKTLKENKNAKSKAKAKSISILFSVFLIIIIIEQIVRIEIFNFSITFENFLQQEKSENIIKFFKHISDFGHERFYVPVKLIL